MVYRESDPQHKIFWHWLLEGICAQNLKATLLFEGFSKAFDSIYRREMEQILIVYSLLKETVAAIMILYKNTKVKVCTLNGDTGFFLDIVAGVLRGDILALYLCIICQDYLLWKLIDLMKENGFTLKKARSRWYPMKTIMDVDYTDDIVLLANTPTQVQSLLHRLE